MLTITETLHHGNYHATTVTTVEALTPATFALVLASSPYTYKPSIGALVRLVDTLTADGIAEWGWSRFTMTAADAVGPSSTTEDPRRTCGGCGETIVWHAHHNEWCGDRSPTNVCPASPGNGHKPADTNVSPVELYSCDECEAMIATAVYLKDCGTCGGIGTVYASSERLPEILTMQTGCCSADVLVSLATYVHGTPPIACPACDRRAAVDFAHAWRHSAWSPATLVALRSAFPLHPSMTTNTREA